MAPDSQFRDIAPSPLAALASADHVYAGLPIPKTVRVTTFSPEEWEAFTEEWASSLSDQYVKVVRFSGAGDKGLDIVGFLTTSTFSGGWDGYQCKRYEHPLRPTEAYPEIGKIIYHSHRGEYPPPRHHYFAPSRGVGTSLERLLASPQQLKEKVRAKWDEYCAGILEASSRVPLAGSLLQYFDSFDFAVFRSQSVVKMLEGHARTRFHAVRFGGGLPLRPSADPPPAEHQSNESRYIRQLYDVYSEYGGVSISAVTDLASRPEYESDLRRQRERFFHAEALRNFARDTVPERTFEDLQDEIYHAVIEICDGSYTDGFARMRATLQHSTTVTTSPSPLQSVTGVRDRQGICHQLANVDRLIWVRPTGESVS
jgi:hypothetical protein